ncbi:MAG: hypothetical protein KAT91_04380 [Candidatus Aenigmarchaeota archaeon]|nr:hypothetical protein [Candidatus Aenigmarchaeota archaeon]
MFSIVSVFFQTVYAEEGTENEYGSFEMQYIGSETPKIGEPGELIVTVTSKSASAVFIKPSFRRGYFEAIHDPRNFVPVSSERISNLSERMDVFQLPSGWTKTFRWTIMPTEKAVGKQDRISIIVDFSKDGHSNQLWVPVIRPRVINETYGLETSAKADKETTPSNGADNTVLYGIGGLVALGIMILFFRK